LVEQWSEEPRVGGSIPSLGTNLTTLPVLRTLAHARFRLLLAAVLALAAAARSWQLVFESFANMSDYRGYFLSASRIAWQGVSPYHPLPVAPPGKFLVGVVSSIDTPSFLMLFWPWTVMSDEFGRLVWIALQVLAVAATLLAVYRGIGRPTVAEVLVAASLLVFFPPLRDAFHEGQVSIFMGLALALALLAHQRGRSSAGGAVLGLAIAIKLSPILVLPYFLYRRDWRLCLAAIGTALMISLATAAAGWMSYWPTFAADIASIAGGTANVLNQSLNGVLLRLTHADFSGLPIPSTGAGFRVLWLAAQAAVIIAIAVVVRRGRLAGPERLWTEYACIVLLLPLVQPFAWEHHFAQAILVVPVAVHLASRGRLGLVAAVVLAAAFAADLLLAYPGFVAAAAAGPAGLANSPALQVAASVTTIAVVAAAMALATARKPSGA
jgi:hypothetical protein